MQKWNVQDRDREEKWLMLMHCAEEHSIPEIACYFFESKGAKGFASFIN
jgi:hypothetical protein